MRAATVRELALEHVAVRVFVAVRARLRRHRELHARMRVAVACATRRGDVLAVERKGRTRVLGRAEARAAERMRRVAGAALTGVAICELSEVHISVAVEAAVVRELAVALRGRAFGIVALGARHLAVRALELEVGQAVHAVAELVG